VAASTVADEAADCKGWPGRLAAYSDTMVTPLRAAELEAMRRVARCVQSLSVEAAM